MLLYLEVIVIMLNIYIRSEVLYNSPIFLFFTCIVVCLIGYCHRWDTRWVLYPLLSLVINSPAGDQGLWHRAGVQVSHVDTGKGQVTAVWVATGHIYLYIPVYTCIYLYIGLPVQSMVIMNDSCDLYKQNKHLFHTIHTLYLYLYRYLYKYYKHLSLVCI